MRETRFRVGDFGLVLCLEPNNAETIQPDRERSWLFSVGRARHSVRAIRGLRSNAARSE
jgi:hypothetical protein